MEVLEMRAYIKPFKIKKMNKRLTLLLANELKNAPVAPMAKLNEEARWLEKYIKSKQIPSGCK